MSWTRNVRHPSKIVSIGETIDAVVLKVDESEEKISLGMKQTEQDPWMILPIKYPVGTRIAGKVRNLTSFGAFVEIEPGIDGLIHISDMSWTKRVQHPSEIVKKGDDTVDVVILNIDADNKRISLGLKQATEDPWLTIGERLPVGMESRATVLRPVDKGIVLDLGNDIEAFAPGLADGHSDGSEPRRKRSFLGRRSSPRSSKSTRSITGSSSPLSSIRPMAFRSQVRFRWPRPSRSRMMTQKGTSSTRSWRTSRLIRSRKACDAGRKMKIVGDGGLQVDRSPRLTSYLSWFAASPTHRRR